MKPARMKIAIFVLLLILCGVAVWRSRSVLAQMPDRTQTPNVANFGIAKSLSQEIGVGQGDQMTPDSSSFIIARDPFRAIRRGRQLFQRKFLRSQGQGPLANDGVGDINTLGLTFTSGTSTGPCGQSF